MIDEAFMAKLFRSLFGCFFPTIALAIFAFSHQAMAQQQTTFCMADGTQIGVEKFETRDGKFLLYVPGSSQPLEYPAASVKGINVKCDPTAAPPPAPVPPKPVVQNNTSGSFGIHGSNTIGERLMPMLIDAFGTKKLGAKPSSKLGASEEQEITLKSTSRRTVRVLRPRI
jgi:phosphate transport system substrate-binding protein